MTTYHHPVPLSRNLGTLTLWNPLVLFRPVTGLLYHYLLPTYKPEQTYMYTSTFHLTANTLRLHLNVGESLRLRSTFHLIANTLRLHLNLGESLRLRSTFHLIANTLRLHLNFGESLRLSVRWSTMPAAVSLLVVTNSGQVLCQVLHINILAFEVVGWTCDWYPCGSQL